MKINDQIWTGVPSQTPYALAPKTWHPGAHPSGFGVTAPETSTVALKVLKHKNIQHFIILILIIFLTSRKRIRLKNILLLLLVNALWLADYYVETSNQWSLLIAMIYSNKRAAKNYVTKVAFLVKSHEAAILKDYLPTMTFFNF